MAGRVFRAEGAPAPVSAAELRDLHIHVLDQAK